MSAWFLDSELSTCFDQKFLLFILWIILDNVCFIGGYS